MSAMQRLMDRMFEDWRPYVNEEGGSTSARALALDVQEDQKAYTVMTEMPGVQPENIQVRHEGDYLIIEGESRQETSGDGNGKKSLIQERHYGRFSRRLRLPQDINFDAAEANYENGVLTLTLPKMEPVQPKMIPIKTGNK
jgi:HSP20 family protein